MMNMLKNVLVWETQIHQVLETLFQVAEPLPWETLGSQVLQYLQIKKTSNTIQYAEISLGASIPCN